MRSIYKLIRRRIDLISFFTFQKSLKTPGAKFQGGLIYGYLKIAQ